MALSKPQRFEHLTLQETEEKQNKMQNDNTISNENKAVKAFKEYLSEISVEDTDFFTYTEQELDQYLPHLLV